MGTMTLSDRGKKEKTTIEKEPNPVDLNLLRFIHKQINLQSFSFLIKGIRSAAEVSKKVQILINIHIF